jgi:hypothetical protein
MGVETAVRRAGWLDKQDPNGGIFKQWKRRFFKLTADAFVYSKTEDGQALREVSLANIKEVQAHDLKGRSGIFMVATNLFQPDGKPRVYILQVSLTCPRSRAYGTPTRAHGFASAKPRTETALILSALNYSRLRRMWKPKRGLQTSARLWKPFEAKGARFKGALVVLDKEANSIFRTSVRPRHSGSYRLMPPGTSSSLGLHP